MIFVCHLLCATDIVVYTLQRLWFYCYYEKAIQQEVM